jgi:hypothetical protein
MDKIASYKACAAGYQYLHLPIKYSLDYQPQQPDGFRPCKQKKNALTIPIIHV